MTKQLIIHNSDGSQLGHIDILIVSPRFSSADFDIPIELWRELIGPPYHEITIAAGMEYYIYQPASGFMMANSIEPMRGFTAAMLDRGADQIYLFNHMDREDAPDDYRAILMQAGQLETVVNKPRRHIVTYHDISPPSGLLPQQLPATVNDVNEALLDIYTGPQPLTGNVIIRLGLAESPDVNEVQLAVYLNSVDCNSMADMPPQFGSARVTQFEAPLAAMQQGYNQVEVFLEEGGDQEIVWTEIYIAP